MALTDYVIMPGSDYQALCDKIREKTGKTGILKSGDLVTEVEEVANSGAGSGGSSAPRIEYTFDSSGNIIAAKGIGLKNIPDYTLYSLNSLGSVDLSESPELTTIGNKFCAYCSNLTEVILPASVASVGSSFISGCYKLKSLHFMGTLAEWVSIDRSNSISGAADFTIYINGIPFAECDMVLPEGLTRIGGYAFYNLSSLTSITIPDTVTNIGQYAFYGTGIRNLVIPDSVTTIGDCAFQVCKSLTSITIGSGVTSMGSNILHTCNALSSITLKDGLTVIGNSMCRYGSPVFTSIVIPASVKKIGQYAFDGARKLKNVTFKDTSGWYVSTSSSATSGTSVSVTNASSAAYALTTTYHNYYWYNGD